MGSTDGVYLSGRLQQVTHRQATDGWTKAAGKGHIVYIQPGHFVEEFTDLDNILNQLILNAVNWKP